MGNFKAFTFGIFTAYTVYFITRKGPDGRSILDDLLDRPDRFMQAARNELVADAAQVLKDAAK